ncbi:hypothetical protein [Pantoea sp. GD03673]|uniref:hypothetical protein n=1 Tax=Pantoea sp. GD03673 TaxID=2975364 RepID=UPI0024492AC3|nr:hypothetical protein [Pantoea sp. GD03673]MDH2069436.1 hypothetical protein [Pantoea sp. GD03673]
MLEAKKYYVSVHYESGTLLHREGCKLLPKTPESRIFIGTLYTTQQAMTVALGHHSNSERCPVCLKIQNPEEKDSRKERLLKLSQKPKKRPAPKAKKAMATQTCQPVKAAALLMKQAIAQEQAGPQQVVKIKKGVEAVAVQHFVYDWPN